jgi:hypothetical protein
LSKAPKEGHRNKTTNKNNTIHKKVPRQQNPKEVPANVPKQKTCLLLIIP